MGTISWWENFQFDQKKDWGKPENCSNNELFLERAYNNEK